MKIHEAVKVAEKSKDVKGLIQEGYFLNSGMAFLEPLDKDVEKWTLTFYNPAKNIVAQVEVDEAIVTLGERGTPIHPTKDKLDPKEIKTSSAKMLEKARNDFKRYKQPISQIIMAIQSEGGKHLWHVNFVTTMLYLITVTLDAKKGNILSSEMHSLAK
jgi:hypothetical protein